MSEDNRIKFYQDDTPAGMVAESRQSLTLSGYSFAQPANRSLSFHGDKGLILAINMTTGETTFGDGYSLGETAKAFWKTIGEACPSLGLK